MKKALSLRGGLNPKFGVVCINSSGRLILWMHAIIFFDQGKQKLAKLTLIQTKAERLVPLDQLIEEADLPATDIVLTNTKGLEVLAERKGDADLNVWKFDKEKALAWLEERVARVAKVLQRQAIDLTQVESSIEA